MSEMIRIDGLWIDEVRTMNSLRCRSDRPGQFSSGALSSAATTYNARTGNRAVIVIDTDTVDRSMPSNSWRMRSVDRHPGHPDVTLRADDQVITAGGWPVERHRQALLARAGFAVAHSSRQRWRSRRNADGPGLVDVHRRIGTPNVRHRPEEAVQR